jgi:hypothetical protein
MVQCGPAHPPVTLGAALAPVHSQRCFCDTAIIEPFFFPQVDSMVREIKRVCPERLCAKSIRVVEQTADLIHRLQGRQCSVIVSRLWCHRMFIKLKLYFGVVQCHHAQLSFALLCEALSSTVMLTCVVFNISSCDACPFNSCSSNIPQSLSASLWSTVVLPSLLTLETGFPYALSAPPSAQLSRDLVPREERRLAGRILCKNSSKVLRSGGRHAVKTPTKTSAIAYMLRLTDSYVGSGELLRDFISYSLSADIVVVLK